MVVPPVAPVGAQPRQPNNMRSRFRFGASGPKRDAAKFLSVHANANPRCPAPSAQTASTKVVRGTRNCCFLASPRARTSLLAMLPTSSTPPTRLVLRCPVRPVQSTSNCAGTSAHKDTRVATAAASCRTRTKTSVSAALADASGTPCQTSPTSNGAVMRLVIIRPRLGVRQRPWWLGCRRSPLGAHLRIHLGKSLKRALQLSVQSGRSLW